MVQVKRFKIRLIEETVRAAKRDGAVCVVRFRENECGGTRFRLVQCQTRFRGGGIWTQYISPEILEKISRVEKWPVQMMTLSEYLRSRPFHFDLEEESVAVLFYEPVIADLNVVALLFFEAFCAFLPVELEALSGKPVESLFELENGSWDDVYCLVYWDGRWTAISRHGLRDGLHPEVFPESPGRVVVYTVMRWIDDDLLGTTDGWFFETYQEAVEHVKELLE